MSQIGFDLRMLECSHVCVCVYFVYCACACAYACANLCAGMCARQSTLRHKGSLRQLHKASSTASKMRAGNLGVARKRKNSEQEKWQNTAYCVGFTVDVLV